MFLRDKGRTTCRFVNVDEDEEVIFVIDKASLFDV